MYRRKYIFATLIFVMLIGAAWVWAAGSVYDQKGVLSGQVAAKGLVTPGAMVREGEVLVYVDTIAGPVPTARATMDGRIKDVLVKPGDVVKAGDTVVRIEKVGK